MSALGSGCRAPELERARRVTRAAVEKGLLVRPETCESCGAKPGLTKRGYAGIQCHHTDYSKPMEVRWLCQACHRAVTPVSHQPGPSLPGSRNPQAKLTEDSVREIRKRYAPGKYGARRLGKEFGVTRETIRALLCGETWTHV